MSLGKASIKRAAGAEKAVSGKTTGKNVEAESVISPMNAPGESDFRFFLGIFMDFFSRICYS